MGHNRYNAKFDWAHYDLASMYYDEQFITAKVKLDIAS